MSSSALVQFAKASRRVSSLCLTQAFRADSAEIDEGPLLKEFAYTGVVLCELEEEACLSMVEVGNAFDPDASEEARRNTTAIRHNN